MKRPKPLPGGPASQELAARRKEKAFRASKLSYVLVFASLALDFAAIQLRDSNWLFLGGLLVMLGWWMAMSTVNSLRGIMNVDRTDGR